MTEASAPPRVGQGRRPAVRRPWPSLPRWFRVGVVAALLVFLGFAAVAVKIMLEVREQPLFERRSVPAAGRLSHDVGRVALPDAPTRPVNCGVITGLRVRGGDIAGPRLVDAIGGLCERLNGVDPALADRILAAARQGTVVSFGAFERTGEFSTTLAGSPPTVVVNEAFLGQFKGYLMPVLAHELWHGGSVDVTAEEELGARRAEAAICKYTPSPTMFRGCVEAAEIVAMDEEQALAALRAAGYR